MDSKIEIRPGRIINLSTYINPNSDTTVFLIHGLGGRGDQFREQLKLLKDYTLIIPDLVGQGRSAVVTSHDNNPYAFTEIAADLEALFTKYAGKQNIVIGHSYGGSFAAYLTLNHQSQIKKLILMTPAPCSPSISVPFVYRFPNWLLRLMRPLLEKQFIKLAFNQTNNASLIETEVQASRANPMEVLKGLITGMKTIPAIDLSQLTTPTLLIIGTNDLLVLPEEQLKFYHVIPKIKVELIDNAAHLIMLEQSDQVNNLILQFLNST